MTDAIAHRGPDGEDLWTQGVVGLGHRRLAIIDLTEGGRQPMQTEDGRYTIVYNGELYNYREIRARLQAKGFVFHSTSDTEVILKAWQAWGEETLHDLNGMFAFAVWDAEQRLLTLVRDRYGIKPLYVAELPTKMLFGSEIKALRAHPEFQNAVDVEGLREYLTFQNFYSQHTLFKGVRLLPPGSVTHARAQPGGLEVPRSYWKPTFHAIHDNRPPQDWSAELLHLFEQAVSRQLVADVEVGGYLSGGLDSGSIVSVASALTPDMRTFTCGFDLSSASGMELFYDERRDAEMMSARFKTEHYEMVLKAGDMERHMPALVEHLEEPRVGQSYPNYLIARLASRFNKVVLSGTGGDELLGGYPWRYVNSVAGESQAVIDKAFDFWQRVFKVSEAETLFAPIWGEVKGVDPKALLRMHFPEMPAKVSAEEAANATMSFEARTFLHGLLVVDDKVSMAHGLEVRVPFLDNDLVDFALSMPPSLKVEGLGNSEVGAKRTVSGKRVFRDAMKQIMPLEIVNRDKQGFSAPDASWFKGQSLDYVRQRLASPRAAIYQFLDFKAVQIQLDAHFSSRENKRLMIWSLLHLEEALNKFNLA